MHKAISAAEAAGMIPDGASIMVGGFMAVGGPNLLMAELARQGRRNLTLIANDTALPGRGIAQLITARAVRKLIASHIGLNPETQKQMLAGELEVELCPQGTLAERIRSGGCGLGGVLTPTGLGTVAAAGKATIEVEGTLCVVEPPLRADFALVAAYRADYLGNLEYELTARNFNPLMAMAGATVIAEVEHIVPLGMLPPDQVMTPHVLVDHVIVEEARHG